MGALAIAFDLSSRHGDGANLYEYLGSNPWNRSDPMGLSWDLFDMVDEYLAETAGEKAALFSALGQSARATAIMAAHIATYLPFPMASLAGELALAAMGEQDMQAAMMAAGIGLVPGGKFLGPAFKSLGKFIGRASVAAWGAARHYAATGARFLWNNSAPGMMHRAWKMLKSCGCFTPETRVWTATGLVAIASIQPGDMVFALDEATGQTSLRVVTEVYEREGDAPLVIVHVSSGETIEWS